MMRNFLLFAVVALGTISIAGCQNARHYFQGHDRWARYDSCGEDACYDDACGIDACADDCCDAPCDCCETYVAECGPSPRACNVCRSGNCASPGRCGNIARTVLQDARMITGDVVCGAGAIVVGAARLVAKPFTWGCRCGRANCGGCGDVYWGDDASFPPSCDPCSSDVVCGPRIGARHAVSCHSCETNAYEVINSDGYEGQEIIISEEGEQVATPHKVSVNGKCGECAARAASRRAVVLHSTTR